MSIIARPQRFSLNIPIQIEWGSATLQASVTIVSANGLFIETANPLWTGATFLANLMLGPPLQLYCTVSRIDPTRGVAVQVAFANKENDQQFTELVKDSARK
jgi:hypothetical protein